MTDLWVIGVFFHYIKNYDVWTEKALPETLPASIIVTPTRILLKVIMAKAIISIKLAVSEVV